jgi:hypothetical protein
MVYVMQIIEALKILAEAKDKQIGYLKNLGTYPSTDELALQFSDTYQVFKGSLEDSLGTSFSIENVLKNLNSINFIFDRMSNTSDNSFWDISSLDNEEWDNIRKLAVETLPLILKLEV